MIVDRPVQMKENYWSDIRYLKQKVRPSVRLSAYGTVCLSVCLRTTGATSAALSRRSVHPSACLPAELSCLPENCLSVCLLGNCFFVCPHCKSSPLAMSFCPDATGMCGMAMPTGCASPRLAEHCLSFTALLTFGKISFGFLPHPCHASGCEAPRWNNALPPIATFSLLLLPSG
jgi:hypothetical protein